MSTYNAVTDAMKAGTPHELICLACPWDRLCITPPELTAADIEKRMAEAKRQDDAQQASRPGQAPMASLMTLMMLGGRDTAGQMCPVFAARLRGPEGREVADAIRRNMRTFGEPKAGA